MGSNAAISTRNPQTEEDIVGGTVMAEWIEYTATGDQIKVLNNALKSSSNGVFLRLKNGDHKIIKSHLYAYDFTHYLICEPHPCADLIKIWADTGCPIYAKHKATGQKDSGSGPRAGWNHEEWEFSLTPFDD